MDGLGVERIEHGRLRAEFAQLWRLFGRVACADDLVAALEQLRNEPLPIAPLAPTTSTFIVFSFSEPQPDKVVPILAEDA
jgi:hypothetical protein